MSEILSRREFIFEFLHQTHLSSVADYRSLNAVIEPLICVSSD